MKRISQAMALMLGVGVSGYAAHVATTFLRFGRTRPARGAADHLLDRFMPTFDVSERHALQLAAPPSATFAVAKQMEFDSSSIVRAIFRGRELLFGSREAVTRPRGGALTGVDAADRCQNEWSRAPADT